MGAPYSLDLRERVVGAVADGMSCAEAAEQYQVSHSSALRWTRRRAETGSPAALPMGGKKPFALADEEAWIRDRVAEKPDITGRELLAELQARGVDVSYYGVWHFLDHTGLSFKKRMARPVCKMNLKMVVKVCANVSGLTSIARSQDGDPRVLVLIKVSASKRRFLNQADRTPVDR
jgi:transposase